MITLTDQTTDSLTVQITGGDGRRDYYTLHYKLPDEPETIRNITNNADSVIHVVPALIAGKQYQLDVYAHSGPHAIVSNFINGDTGIPC